MTHDKIKGPKNLGCVTFPKQQFVPANVVNKEINCNPVVASKIKICRI